MRTTDTIKLKVLYFGATADVVGVRSEDLHLPAGTESQTAFEQVVRQHPSLALHNLLYSVNQRYASGSEVLSDDDELAVFTAVSGG